jgi:hypothetical protein
MPCAVSIILAPKFELSGEPPSVTLQEVCAGDGKLVSVFRKHIVFNSGKEPRLATARLYYAVWSFIHDSR